MAADTRDDPFDDEFLATLVHELRNPLAALSAASHLLARADQKPEIAAMAREALHRQVADMSHLLDDVVDVARLRRGELELRKQRVDLDAALREAIDAAAPLVEAKHLELHVELCEQPMRVEADPACLAQITRNLVAHAVKQTVAGGQITVRASIERRNAVVSVSDSGASAGRRARGVRIGLMLVEGLVSLHGGSFTAGNTIVVRLPLVD